MTPTSQRVTADTTATITNVATVVPRSLDRHAGDHEQRDLDQNHLHDDPEPERGHRPDPAREYPQHRPGPARPLQPAQRQREAPSTTARYPVRTVSTRPPTGPRRSGSDRSARPERRVRSHAALTPAGCSPQHSAAATGSDRGTICGHLGISGAWAVKCLPPRLCSAPAPPLPGERHDDRASKRTDDSTRPEGHTISGHKAHDESTDEGAHEACRECESPVNPPLPTCPR